MNPRDRIFVVNNIKLPVCASFKEAFSVAEKKLKSLGITTAADYRIYRRSTDARNKDKICFVYSIAARAANTRITDEELLSHGVSRIIDSDGLNYEMGEEKLLAPPVIVGAGPCGLFAALLLAEAGYNPIVIERGGDVKSRIAAHSRFLREHTLDCETNIQFGAGGAGTFSDGKLVTRINDPISSYVLKRFVEFGAPEDIVYVAKPHIGTDILTTVVENMITKIRELGGKVLFNTRFERPVFSGGSVKSIKTSSGDMPVGALILALGHSARDTYKNLIDAGVSLEAKSFSVGMRIEHLTEDIDTAMYGKMAGNSQLGHAEYNLSHNTSVRGVYTFCMCPGGEVVAAASECGGVVVNGMSKRSRDGRNSNSAVCCTVFREDYGSTPLLAIEYQRNIERRAFLSGGGGYRAPIITLGDFLSDELKHEPSRIMPTYMGGNVKLASPLEYLPKTVTDAIKNSFSAFDKRISGFAAPDAVLTGPETRTSAPVRITRDNDTRVAIGYKNIYPAGEGAGYAGGITSASVDGIKTALSVIKRYKP